MKAQKTPSLKTLARTAARGAKQAKTPEERNVFKSITECARYLQRQEDNAAIRRAFGWE